MIPCILPLLNEKFILDFREKTELFNDFFTRQCSFATSNSELPYRFLREKRASHFQQLTFRNIIF